MNKTEMQAHQSRYDALMAQAQSAEQQGLFRASVDLAVSAFEHIDGMMQYERKYEERDFVSVSAIEMVLKYCPLLFYSEYLQKLESILGEYRRIERDTSADLAAKVADARTRMWHNHRLWEHIEARPETRQDQLRTALGYEQEYWRSVAEAWEKMGLLTRTPEAGSYRLALRTRMGQIISVKCPRCGEIVEAPKAMVLEESTCPECADRVWLVILGHDAIVRE